MNCPLEDAERLAVEATADPSKLPEYEQAMQHAAQLERGGFRRRIDMAKGKTQIEKLIRHMRDIGPISLREALLEYDVQSLPRRIKDIKELGYQIEAIQKRNPVTGQEYTRYALVGDAPIYG